ncbi:MAG: isochorismate synthase [Sciscionella sp.]
MGITSESASAPRLVATTREFDAAGALLDALPEPEGTLAWVRQGEGIVGWGVAAECSPRGAGRFGAAERWWAGLVDRIGVRDEVELPGTGLVAFASLAFADRPGTSRLIVPRVLIGRRGDTGWITTFDTRLDVGVTPVRAPGPPSYSQGRVSVAGYRAAVAAAVRRIRAGELGKVVLAHDLLATTRAPLDERFLLRGLAQRYPSCWTFAVDGLLGATPELLLAREGDQVSARLLAGTAWPRAGQDPDGLAAELLGSAKNRGEHQYGIDSLRAALAPFCERLQVPAQPSVLRLPNVAHLASDVRGTLDGDASLLRLAQRVHPTAAVGGTPRAQAVAAIGELEGMDRGRYAGPVGWIDARGNGELGVALRCGLRSGNTLRLFAGCGIVADSQPDSEVTEAAAKFVPMRDALERTTD